MADPVRRLGEILSRVKAAWEWWALIAAMLGLPSATVILGVLWGQTPDVILLYIMAGVAFAVVLWTEGQPLLDRLRRAKPVPSQARSAMRRDTWATITFYRKAAAQPPRLERSENVAAILPQADDSYHVVWSHPFPDDNYQVNLETDGNCAITEERHKRRGDRVVIYVHIWSHGPDHAVVTVTATGPAF